MEIDYSKGRYNVFGPNGQIIGRIDEDEFVRSGTTLIYRIDGNEVYEINGGVLGYVDSGVAATPNGKILFTIQSE